MGSNRLLAFEKRLIELRIAQGLNQTQFAKLVNLTQGAISQYEDGKRIPSSSALQKMEKGLGLSLEELIGSEGEVSFDTEKEAAIQALVAKLNRKSVSTEAIIALTQFIDAYCQ
jgi:transcriptional regulator with XRE-family HTH domain